MSKTKIINFLVALKHEALPIIDNFELILHDKKYRNIFSNVEKSVFLIIPEIWAHFAEDMQLKKRKINYAIFVQGLYSTNNPIFQLV